MHTVQRAHKRLKVQSTQDAGPVWWEIGWEGYCCSNKAAGDLQNTSSSSSSNGAIAVWDMTKDGTAQCISQQRGLCCAHCTTHSCQIAGCQFVKLCLRHQADTTSRP